jgi:hypothetical protein
VPQEDVLPGATYEGWIFQRTDGRMKLRYSGGMLRTCSMSTDVADDEYIDLPLSRLSIGELIQYDVLVPLHGHSCSLPLTNCPECAKRAHLGTDYVCHRCRKTMNAS